MSGSRVSLPGMFRVCNGITRPALLACRAQAWHRRCGVGTGRASSTTAASEPSLPTPTPTPDSRAPAAGDPTRNPETEEAKNGDKLVDVDSSTATTSPGVREEPSFKKVEDLAQFNIHQPLLQAAVLKNVPGHFKKLTRVEAATIPEILAGHDLLVTDSGDQSKIRYSYLLPTLHRILNRDTTMVEHPKLIKALKRSRGVEMLILCPNDARIASISPVLNRLLAPFPQNRAAKIFEYDKTVVLDKLEIARAIRKRPVLVTTPHQLVTILAVQNILRDKMTCLETIVVDGIEDMNTALLLRVFRKLGPLEIAEQQRLIFTQHSRNPQIERLANTILRKDYKIINSHRK